MEKADYAKLVENAAQHLKDAGFESIVIITTAPSVESDETSLYSTALGNTFANDRAVQFWIENYSLAAKSEQEPGNLI